MNPVADAFTLRLNFHGDLPFFVRPKRGARQVVRQLPEKTSVKDAIEACGVPHPEIDLILVDNQPADFTFTLQSAARIDVHPVTAPADLFPAARLQRRRLNRFVADGHLGKLTRDLRLLGIDVAYSRETTDPELVARSAAEDRALLTRDRFLLMHGAVRDGYYLRSQNPEEQTREVVVRFNLRDRIASFTRCLRCNGLLATVSKAEVFEQLEPLTKIYYETFRRCRDCGCIYWSGSHFDKLRGRIDRLLAASQNPPEP
ncbi:MAG TPA: Mut7-C RNAse domain-containing protein [Chthoniobacterales bacterium]|nr:Mut7-C RNAse domain-containing protein [Chthoniobacterales bacterium]